MMMRGWLYTFLLMLSLCSLPLQAQTTKKIQNLQARRTELQNQINQSEKILLTMKKDVKSQLSDLAVLNSQVSQQEKLVNTIENDVGTLDVEVAVVELQLDSLERDYQGKKDQYEAAMKYAFRKNRGIQDKLMFIFSARNMLQMYRRARYVREYTTYLKAEAEQIAAKQRQVQQKKSDLLAAKGEKSSLLHQQEQEKVKLQSKQDEQKKLVTSLQKKQKDVQKEIAQKKKQHEQLDAQIDRLVEQEIAAAKKREAERQKKEAARKEAERKRLEAQQAAEARRLAEEKKAAAEAAKTATAASSTTTKKTTTATSSTTNRKAATKTVAKTTSRARTTTGNATITRPTETTVATTPAPTRAQRMDVYESDNSDQRMAGSFERNKGSMPMPITGSYTIVSHYGAHNVSGLSNVSLDNKGIDIKGQAGASARAIFDGEVSAVFSYAGVKGILVRHGNYISVYCNLSSVSVSQGQKVKARDVLGKVANSGEEGYILHFQLRKETTKLNPESWLRR